MGRREAELLTDFCRLDAQVLAHQEHLPGARGQPAQPGAFPGPRLRRPRGCEAAARRSAAGRAAAPRSRPSVALLVLDRPGNDRAGLTAAALAIRLLRVLARTAGAERHREDLERRYLGRCLEETAVRLGGHR